MRRILSVLWELSAARIVESHRYHQRQRLLEPHLVSSTQQMARHMRREVGSVSSGEHELEDLTERPIRERLP